MNDFRYPKMYVDCNFNLIQLVEDFWGFIFDVILEWI